MRSSGDNESAGGHGPKSPISSHYMFCGSGLSMYNYKSLWHFNGEYYNIFARWDDHHIISYNTLIKYHTIEEIKLLGWDLNSAEFYQSLEEFDTAHHDLFVSYFLFHLSS